MSRGGFDGWFKPWSSSSRRDLARREQEARMMEADALRLAKSVVSVQFRTHLGRRLTESDDIDTLARGILKAGLTVDRYEEMIVGSEEYRLRNRREIIEFEGVKFNLPPLSSLMLVLKSPESYERYVLPEFLSLCKPGMHVVDVGANWGVYSMPAARRVGESGRVWAFEANAKNAEFILEAIELNGLSNVELVPAAVGKTFGHAVMPDLEATNSGHVVFGGRRAGNLIPVVPLDAVLSDVARLDLIKMDIEGSEYRACLGARKIIDRFRPTVFLEFSPPLLGRNAEKLLRFFLDRDYDIAALPYHAYRRDVTGTHEEIVSEVVGLCPPGITHVDLRMSPRR